MKKQIIESGILFEIEEEYLYHIERSQLVKNTKYFKSPEFIYLEKGRIVMVEAKTSAPHPSSKEDFKNYLSDIREKFFNAMALLNACWSQRNVAELNMMPLSLQQQTMPGVQFQLYLVVAKAKEEWLPNINDALKSELQILFKIWCIPDTSIRVITKERAIQLGLAAES